MPNNNEFNTAIKIFKKIYGQDAIGRDCTEIASIIEIKTRYQGQDASFWFAEAEKQRVRADEAEAKLKRNNP